MKIEKKNGQSTCISKQFTVNTRGMTTFGSCYQFSKGPIVRYSSATYKFWIGNFEYPLFRHFITFQILQSTEVNQSVMFNERYWGFWMELSFAVWWPLFYCLTQGHIVMVFKASPSLPEQSMPLLLSQSNTKPIELIFCYWRRMTLSFGVNRRHIAIYHSPPASFSFCTISARIARYDRDETMLRPKGLGKVMD